MALHDQGNTQQNAAELGRSAASPLGKNDEAESVISFNLSSLVANSSPATMFQSYSSLGMEDITGSQARPSESHDESMLGDYSSLLYPDDLRERDTSYPNMTTNDDMKWQLLGLSTRLHNLETAVANGNARIAHLSAQIMALTNGCLKGDEFQRAMSNLNKGLKELVVTLVAGGLGDSKTKR